MTTVAVGNRRLLKLADILDKADALHRKLGEPGYDQTRVSHNNECRTPACAWGHWRAQPNVTKRLGEWASMCFIESEFSISEYDAELIFGGEGCESAKTAKQAAKYIRAFVKRRQVRA